MGTLTELKIPEYGTLRRSTRLPGLKRCAQSVLPSSFGYVGDDLHRQTTIHNSMSHNFLGHPSGSIRHDNHDAVLKTNHLVPNLSELENS